MKPAALHIVRVRVKEKGKRYLERMGGMQRTYSGYAERETLLILY